MDWFRKGVGKETFYAPQATVHSSCFARLCICMAPRRFLAFTRFQVDFLLACSWAGDTNRRGGSEPDGLGGRLLGRAGLQLSWSLIRDAVIWDCGGGTEGSAGIWLGRACKATRRKLPIYPSLLCYINLFLSVPSPWVGW